MDPIEYVRGQAGITQGFRIRADQSLDSRIEVLLPFEFLSPCKLVKLL